MLYIVSIGQYFGINIGGIGLTNIIVVRYGYFNTGIVQTIIIVVVCLESHLFFLQSVA